MIEYFDVLENVQNYNNFKEFLDSSKIGSKRGLGIIHFNIGNLRQH